MRDQQAGLWGHGLALGLPIQAVVVGQDSLVADSILSSYRTWVAETPAAASLFAIATVGFELAGPLMIAGRKTRLCVALGLLAMHANIYVLTRILYWESMVLLGLWVLRQPAETRPWRSPRTRATSDHHCHHGAGIVRDLPSFIEPPVYGVARNEAGKWPGQVGTGLRWPRPHQHQQRSPDRSGHSSSVKPSPKDVASRSTSLLMDSSSDSRRVQVASRSR